jgi:hypothetical protein
VLITIFPFPREPGLNEKIGESEATVATEEAIAVRDVIENGEDRGLLVTGQDRLVANTKRTPILPAVIIALESGRIDIKADEMRGNGIEIGAKGGVNPGAKKMTDPRDVIENCSMTNPAVAPAEIEAILSVGVETERRV